MTVAPALSNGASGFVFSTHDRGATWASVPVGNAQTGLTGVAATANGEVYVVGYTNPFILPDTPIIYAVAGNAADVWAVGGSNANAMSAIYRKTLAP